MASDIRQQVICRPGDLAPVSGVYLVKHLNRHRAQHEALVIRGEEFPICRTCKNAIGYELLRHTDHIHHDWDLTGPAEWAVEKKVPELESVRAFDRVEIDLPIILVEMLHSKLTVLLHGRATSLSEGGLGAVIKNRLTHPRNSFTIRFLGADPCQDLNVNARLRYRNGMRCGFEFRRMSPLDRDSVRELCRKIAS